MKTAARTSLDLATTRQVMALQRRSIEELKVLWVQIFDEEKAPHYPRAYFIRRLAYRIQELAYGTLPQKAEQQLNRLVTHLERHGDIPGKAKTHKPPEGTVLMRDYQGVRHEVLVGKDDFIYQGKPYASLSAVARHITGTRWNGHIFFGLKRRK